MTKDEFIQCLEPLATKDCRLTRDSDWEGAIQISIAISLKRIADRLDWDYEDRLRERNK